MHPVELTVENFETEVLGNKNKVLVDFWAPRCGPCVMLAPTIEQLAEEVDDVAICKIDVDAHPEIAVKYGIRNIPTLMVFEGGEVTETAVGLKSKPEILTMLGK